MNIPRLPQTNWPFVTHVGVRLGVPLLMLGVLVIAAWAVVLATDTFDRANGALGATWTHLSGISGNSLVISGNVVIPNAIGSNAHHFYNAVVFPNDQYAEAIITVTGGNAGSESGAGVAVRASGTNNLYSAKVNKAATNNVALSKTVAGTYSGLWARTQAWTDGDVLRLEVTGTSLVVKRNGVAIGAAHTDTSLTSGAPGLSFGQGTGLTAATWNNFEAGDFTTGALTKKRVILY